MSANKVKNSDYKSLSSAPKSIGASGDTTLRPPQKPVKNEREGVQDLKNLSVKPEKKQVIAEPQPAVNAEPIQARKETPKAEEVKQPELSYSEQQKQNKKQKAVDKDIQLLNSDRWLIRNGHTLTYVGVFLFTLVVYFRPYELIPALSGLKSMALILAIATLLVYLPTQFSVEGSLTTLSTEVKCVLFLFLWGLITIPIAKSPGLAWEKINDTFIKVVLIFIVMVNTLRTQARLKGLMWLSIGVGVMLSYQAIDLYQRGVFAIEGYRVSVDFGGMFGNPNDMAIHLVIFTPIAFVLGLTSKNLLSKIVYFASAAMMIAGNMVTQSRGGFLGLIAVGGVLAWKLGKKQRVKVVSISAVIGLIVILLAPGNYGLRILSIFIPGLDPVGSSDQRKELLEQSIWVTLRNPLGIGFGNFPIVGVRNLETHNSYTQVSSELGWLALAAYIILMVSPLRKLGAIERQMFERNDSSWMYYLAIGIEASIVGYMVSSFFGPVAYNWYVYYPIAYAVCLRRIYQTAHMEKDAAAKMEAGLMDYFKPQRA